MDDFTPERKQFAIVLAGTFNPLMFQPEWFGRYGVISQEEVESSRNQSNAQPTIITPQLSFFRTSQLNVSVDEARFQVQAEKEPFLLVKDFVKNTFERLGGLTLSAYGFNYSAHYKFRGEAELNAFADRLAPKQYWRTLLGKDVSGDNRTGGLIAIHMSQAKEQADGLINVQLQRSVLTFPGVFIHCNDHTDAKKDRSSADDVIEELDKRFESSLAFLLKIQNDLLTEATKND